MHILNVLKARTVIKIIRLWIRTIIVFMAYFLSLGTRPDERRRNERMNALRTVRPAKAHSRITVACYARAEYTWSLSPSRGG